MHFLIFALGQLSQGRSVSDPGGAMNIADPMTGTFVYLKLGHLQNFMQNECSLKCL